MSVTEPRVAPRRLASCVSGHRHLFATKTRLSPATTPAATAVRRSERLANPVNSTYTTHDSIENHASVCTSLIAASLAAAIRRASQATAHPTSGHREASRCRARRTTVRSFRRLWPPGWNGRAWAPPGRAVANANRPCRSRADWAIGTHNPFERAIRSQTCRIARSSGISLSGRAIRQCPPRIGGSSRSRQGNGRDGWRSLPRGGRVTLADRAGPAPIP